MSVLRLLPLLLDLAVAGQPARAIASTSNPELQGPGNTSPCRFDRDDAPGCISPIGANGFYFQTEQASDHDPSRANFWLPAAEARVYLPVLWGRWQPTPYPTPTNTPAWTATPMPTAIAAPAIATASPTTAATARPTSTATPTKTATSQPGSAFLSITALNCSAQDEVAAVHNDEARNVTMTGWKLISVAGTQTYTFPVGYVLGDLGEVRVHSGPGAGPSNPPRDLP